MKYILSKALGSVFEKSLNLIVEKKNQFITPEHILMSIFSIDEVIYGSNEADIDFEGLYNALLSYVNKLEKVNLAKYNGIIYNSSYTSELLKYASLRAKKKNRLSDDNKYIVTIPDILVSIYKLNDSWAKNVISAYISPEQLGLLNLYIEENIKLDVDPRGENILDEEVKDTAEDFYDKFDEMSNKHDYDDQDEENTDEDWKKELTCISDEVKNHSPVIGREDEINLTLQTLCRKDKKNPIHIGDPGVGKTSLIYKLAERINSGNVPDCLKGARIYRLDAGTLMAGTRYRGDLEKRIKSIMEGIENEGNSILYLDDIHNIMGAGKNYEGTPGVAELLMPYLEGSNIRIIGSTTYDDFKKNMARNNALMRRFHQIDIKEPSVEESVTILKGLKKIYEKYHNVYYTDKALVEAVTGSNKYMTNRFLPDKAIDLIDEAGAYRVMHPLNQKRQTITEDTIRDILYKTCKIDSEVITEKTNKSVATLHERISNKIFGQSQAVSQVVNAVEISKAGLGDENKPMASMLFVGSTGVGKTELAKVLAEEMNVSLIRFDMSEYTEKHTVAKFIGSPAGYVGYEDGGLLTDAIRKSPNCVLLLDEIEKAHQDIYNILLQVMDYGTLTDSHGMKADFKNVILIMTSNAGAQYAAQASVGFTDKIPASHAMLKEVKRVFKPEFINRLSCITMFNDMTREMAELIMNKKLSILSNKLESQNISMTLDDSARLFILNHGFSEKYGAREMERTISKELKPLLTYEILYGQLKKGGCITFGARDGKINILNIKSR